MKSSHSLHSFCLFYLFSYLGSRLGSILLHDRVNPVARSALDGLRSDAEVTNAAVP